jgi:molybdopterin biosynthesis enzyme
MTDANAPQRIERLMPLTDALACVDRLVGPVAPRRMSLGQAAGLTLADDIVNRYSHPGSAIALRDGIAVDAAATLDASSYAPAPLAGAPVFVDVGDPLPAGTDAIAPLDMVELRAQSVHALAPLTSGDGVLPQGGDATAGDVLAMAGARLRPRAVTALSVLGVSEAAVRHPLVRINVTHSSHLRDRVISAIVNLLSQAVEAAGARALVGQHTRHPYFGDIPGEMPAASAVMLIGGSGSGRRDENVRDLARFGSVAFHGVALAPGETAALGMFAQQPVLIVPGRLDAALAVWLTLGRRMVARLAGYDDAEPGMSLTLTRKITSTLGLAEVVPVVRDGDMLTPLASGHLPLQALVRADGYVLVPAESEGFPAGAHVEMRPLP